MSFERKVSEPRMVDGKMVRIVKIGGRLQGYIEATKSKLTDKVAATYWTVPPVMRLFPESNCILVKKVAMDGLRMYGVGDIGLRLPDGTSYSMPIALLADAHVVPDATKLYHVVPMNLWVVDKPPIDERVATVMSTMRVAGGRRKSALT